MIDRHTVGWFDDGKLGRTGQGSASATVAVLTLVPEFDPSHPLLASLRLNPEAVSLSAGQAAHLVRLPDSVKRYLFSRPEPLPQLLPEHRDVVNASISQTAAPALAGPALSDQDAMMLSMETLAALDRDGDALRARLKTALTAGDRAEVTRHLTDALWSTWLLSRVLEPFCQDYALDLARMGIDPELVRVRARSLQAADGLAEGGEAGVIADAMPVPPPLPQPKVASVRRQRATIVRYQGDDLTVDTLRGLVAMTRPPVGSVFDEYGRLIGLSDAIEDAIRGDEGAESLQTSGDPRNCLCYCIPRHPLGALYRTVVERRVALALAISRLPQAAAEGLKRLPEVEGRLRADIAAERWLSAETATGNDAAPDVKRATTQAAGRWPLPVWRTTSFDEVPAASPGGSPERPAMVGSRLGSDAPRASWWRWWVGANTAKVLSSGHPTKSRPRPCRLSPRSEFTRLRDTPGRTVVRVGVITVVLIAIIGVIFAWPQLADGPAVPTAPAVIYVAADRDAPLFFDQEKAQQGLVSRHDQAHILAGARYPVVMLGTEVVELRILTARGSESAWVRARDVHVVTPP